MGTRCLTVFVEENNDEICVLYRQMDGYPDGHGKELADFLLDMKITDGLTFSSSKTANGMSCLAAQVIAYFKTCAGGFYLHPAKTRDCWEQYIYTIKLSNGEGLNVQCLDVYNNKILFDGSPEFMIDWLHDNYSTE